MACGHWSSELAAEFGLPDGWYVYRQLKNRGGKLLKRAPNRVGSFNIGVDQNIFAKREMDEMAREFTLLVKPPCQG